MHACSIALTGTEARPTTLPTLHAAFIDKLLELRLQARKDKDFAKADVIRDMLSKAGLAVEDTPQGPRWSLE